MQQNARTAKQIGAIVRRARRSAGLTQAALAERVGLRQATISRLERGEDETKVGTLLNVLAALGLQLVIEPRARATAEDIERLF